MGTSTGILEMMKLQSELVATAAERDAAYVRVAEEHNRAEKAEAERDEVLAIMNSVHLGPKATNILTAVTAVVSELSQARRALRSIRDAQEN